MINRFYDESLNIKLGTGIQVKQSAQNFGIAIGHFSAAKGQNAIAIGSGGSNGVSPAIANGDYAIAIGVNTEANNINGLGEIKIGNPRFNSYYYDGGTGWKVGSDVRDKINIKPINNCLDFISAVEPIKFRYNFRKSYSASNSILDYDEEAHSKGSKAEKTFNYGVKAQDVADALKNIYGSEFYGNIISKQSEADFNKIDNSYSVNLVNFIPFLIGAIKEQQKQIEDLKSQVEVLNGKQKTN